MPFQLIRGDLLDTKAEVIVNAANEELRCFSHTASEGGVCGAIFHKAGFDALTAACRKLAPCPTGQAVATPGFALRSKYIIHAVGPVWRDGRSGEEDMLASAYRAALRLCRQLEAQSIAFPLISSGLFNCPQQTALRVAIHTILDFLDKEDPDGSLHVELVLRGANVSVSDSRLRRMVLEGLPWGAASRSYERLSSGTTHSAISNIPQHALDQALFSSSAHESMPLPPADAMPAEAMPSEAQRPRPMKAPMAAAEPVAEKAAIRAGEGFLDRIRAKAREAVRHQETFSDQLLRLIDETGETDAAVYKRANVDRRVFSKIRSDRAYRPSKGTALAFCLALRLKPGAADALLSAAGLAFSSADLRDQVVRSCLEAKVFDVFDVNSILFDLDLPGLGL